MSTYYCKFESPESSDCHLAHIAPNVYSLPKAKADPANVDNIETTTDNNPKASGPTTGKQGKPAWNDD
jgi:hypothetical protein